MTFKTVIHPEPKGGYWGEVPALTGCYSQGETVEELLANLREAAQGCLEVLRAEGRSPDPEVEIAELAV
ncbi:MAG TPA: type II toxin-antitoxin system HicB family antitoxin [Verrucomicrobiae bacterium]|jgi:predicted RNase H-like HicB family nuclease